MKTGTILITSRLTSGNPKLRRICLSVDGVITGELSLLQNSILVPPGQHRIEVVTSSGEVISNTVDLTISAGERVVFENYEKIKALPPLSLRLLDSDKKRNWFFILKSLAIVLPILICFGYGIVTSFRHIIVPGYHYLFSTTAASGISLTFWESVLDQGKLTPETQSSLASDFERHADVDWSQITTKMASHIGANLKITVVSHDHGTAENGRKHETTVLKMSGENGTVYVVTFLTSAADDSVWRIAGFDVVHGELEVQSFSEHLPDHPRSSHLFVTAQKIYK